MKTLIALILLSTLSLMAFIPNVVGVKQEEVFNETEKLLEVVTEGGWEWII